MEAKYQRVLVSSLQGFASFVQKIPMSNLETVEENIKKFLSHKRFWKLASNKLPLVSANHIHYNFCFVKYLSVLSIILKLHLKLYYKNCVIQQNIIYNYHKTSYDPY